MARSLLHQYWDLPEGTECHRKAYASTSVGGAAGLIVSAYSIALKPPASFLEGVARTGRYTFTAAAIGAIFGLTTCVSAQVRGKPDDPLNYLIGGCAGGLTLGARETMSWCPCCFADLSLVPSQQCLPDVFLYSKELSLAFSRLPNIPPRGWITFPVQVRFPIPGSSLLSIMQL
uniref:NADH dehydrogenase [ubiquinone] 1 alpha subcomplex subunit 11 n=1 Tax=Equus caballus TaxID=9796 RepID=A0A9L0QXA0_HORSE